MEKIAVMIGLGQLGRVFAGGLLKTGHIVVPANRGDDLVQLAARWPEPDLVMISVAEPDMHPVMSALPETWKDSVGLLQNELLPRDWRAHEIENPTVISVWFEKKAGKDSHPLLSSPVYGPASDSLVRALNALDLPAHAVADAEQLEWELVRKNLYILSTNIAGLDGAGIGNVGQLRDRHAALLEAVARDVLDVQMWLVGRPLDRASLMSSLFEAMAADPNHACAGRSAPSRLKRALHHADAAGLATPELRRIAAEQGIV